MTEAKLKYKQGSFEIVKDGDYVFCAVSKRKIPLNELSCLLYTSPSPRDPTKSRMPSSA